MGRGRCEPARRIGNGTEEEMMESGTGFIGRYAGRTLHQPVEDTTESVMVERVHTVVASETVFMCERVEPLPYRRGTLRDGIEP